MSLTTPSVSGDQSVVADAVVARGNLSTRGTLDLRAKIGAFLFVAIGRGGTTALDVAVTALVRATLGNDAKIHPSSSMDRLGSTAAASGTTVDADSAAGQTTLNVTSTTGFAAGDLICIQDAGGGVTRLEWARVSKVTNPGASGELILDRDLQYAHTAAQADTVRNKSDVFSPVWLPGGALYEVRFDYGEATTGESVTVRARAQVVDNFTTT